MPHDEKHAAESPVTRRAVVAGTGILAAAAALAGCSSYGQGAASGQPPAAGQAPGAPSGAPAPAGAALAGTADIPVGGGEIFPAQQVVVTQAAQGKFRAFSAICTHQGCTVNKVAGGTIDCPCHGSKYAVTDGSVVSGPAKKPLPPRSITVQGNTIRLA